MSPQPDPARQRRRARREGRLLRRCAVLFGLGLLLALLPIPTFTFATQAVGAAADVPTPVPMTADQLAAAQRAADEPIGTDRVTATDDDTGTITAIGFSFESPPTSPVMVRIKDAAGAFGPWREMDATTEEGPDPGSPEADASSSVGTEPMWVRDATGYEVSFAAEDADGAQVVTVRDELHRSVAEATPFADAAVAPSFGINLRSSWGARAARSTSYGSTVKLGVVHHSDSGNDYSQAEVPGILRSIQAYHMDAPDHLWSDIGYNFVVDRFGTIWEGRAGGIDRSVVGAHAAGFNTNSVGVVVIGDYTQTTPTAASLESVSRVIGWKMALFGNDPTAPVAFTSACSGTCRYPAGQVVNLPGVVGHQDVGLTGCPGSIESSLGSVRARAGDWYRWTRATMVPAGLLENLSMQPGQIVADGFAFDPAADAPAKVRLDVDGTAIDRTTTVARPDIAGQHPDWGSTTGFHIVASGLDPGWHRACVTVIGASGVDAPLGCRDLKLADPANRVPLGAISSTSSFVGGFTVRGWAYDPDTAGPVTVDVLSNGAVVGTVQVARDAYFDLRVPGVVGGSRLLCLRVRNVGAGSDSRVDCRDLYVSWASPRGSMDVARRDGDRITAWGWAVDDETVDPTFVMLIVDGRVTVAWADQPRPDWQRLYPDLGPNHAWGTQVAVGPGPHEVCAVARNVGGGSDTWLRCTTVK